MTAEPEVPVDDLLWVCTNLCELIEAENHALLSHDIATVAELTENKAALARFYEQLVGPIAANPALAEALEPERKEELTALGSRLAELMVANATLLTAEMNASQMLMDAVVSSARSTVGSVNYSRDGTLERPPGDQPAVSLNKTL